MSQDLFQRIIELETKVAFQEDTIGQLNEELSHHQESIHLLQEQLRLLGNRFSEMKDQISTEGSEVAVEEIPPHY